MVWLGYNINFAVYYLHSGEDSDLDMGLLSLLGGPGMILVAASAGDVDRVRELLQKKPRQV